MLLSGVASAGPGLTTPEPIGPFLDGAFPISSPGTSPDAAWVQENYYPGLTFVEPIRILQHPALDRLVVVCKDGKGGYGMQYSPTPLGPCLREVEGETWGWRSLTIHDPWHPRKGVTHLPGAADLSPLCPV